MSDDEPRADDDWNPWETDEAPEREPPPPSPPDPSYRCVQGHVTQGVFRYDSFKHATGELEATTGPICRICVLTWAGDAFRCLPVAE